jgi:hypothetical protein
MVAVSHGGGADSGRVAAGAWLGHRDADDRLAGHLGRRADSLELVDDDRVVTEVVDTGPR